MKVRVELVERRNMSGVKNGREWTMDDTYIGYLVPYDGVDFKGSRFVAIQYGLHGNYDLLPTPPFIADIELGTGFDMRGDPVQIVTKCVPVPVASVNTQK